MNPSVLGAAATTLLVVLWLLTRRRSRPFLRSDDTSAVAALNRAQLTRLQPPRAASPAAFESAVSQASASEKAPDSTPHAFWPPLPAPSDARGRRRLLTRLAAAAEGPLPQRLEALRIARRWRHRAVLPLLRRSLRDVHPAVVREAALALEAYRGRSSLPSAPRSVARTR
jgi:hypothetical protein